MRTILLSVFALCSCGLFSQQITVDTSWTSDVPGEVEQYWFWASGVTVNGEGFTPNSAVTVFSEDPEGFSWREFEVTSDASGNFTVVINAMKNRSVLGTHTAYASDAEGLESSEDFSVVANVNEVIEVSTNVSEITMTELYFGEGVVVTASGITPNAEIVINMGDPAGNGMQIDPENQKFADENGNYTLILDGSTVVGVPGQTYPIPQVEGMWFASFNDMSGTGYYGAAEFRLLPDTLGTYCIPNIGAGVQPISKVELNDLVKESSLDSTDGYEDFTDETANVEAGNTYTIKVQGKAQWSFNVNTYTAFIDWNQNGILDEEGEIYSLGFLKGSTGEDGMQVEYDIKIPETALNGTTRMRILKVNSVSTTAMFWPEGACGTYAFGQIEDYSLEITGGVPQCTVTCPEDITVQADEEAEGAVVTYELNFDCDSTEGVELVLAEGLASGSEFPIGTTTVTHNLVYEGETLDTCTFTVTVEEFMNVSDLNQSIVSVYPNPVKDILNITGKEEIYTISIFDMTGKQVYTQGIHNKNAQLNIAHLAAGVYVVKTQTNGEVKTFKIVKK